MQSNKTEYVYYNAEIINSTSQNILAKNNVQLLQPLFRDPSKYNLCINRFRLPLNGIPLTKNNIPFQQWQVSLGFKVGNVWNYENAYVPQYNPSTQTNWTTYNMTNTVFQKVNNNLALNQVITSSPIQSLSPYKPTYDFIGTVGTYYTFSSDLTHIYAYEIADNSPKHSFSAPPGFLYTAIVANPTTGDVYIAMAGVPGLTSAGILYFARQSNTTYQQITASDDIQNGQITSLTYTNNYILAGFQANAGIGTTGIYLFGTSVGTLLNQVLFNDAHRIFVSANPTETNNFVYVANTTTGYISRFVISNNALTLAIEELYPMTYSLGSHVSPLIGFTTDGNVLITGLSENSIGIRNMTTLSNIQYITITAGSYLLFTTPQTTTIAPSGQYSLWTYQDYLVKINAALTTAFNAIKLAFPAYAPTSAPEIFFDSTTRLFYMLVQSEYIESSSYVIDFNQLLYNMFLFPSVVDSNNAGYRTILCMDSSTGVIPPFISVYQEAGSLSHFYDLVRILILSQTMPINGDLEGKNSSLKVITDVVPDVDTLSPSGILIYQPTIPRVYNMYSSSPLNNIDIQFAYGTKDGSIYEVDISPNEYASAKLQFFTST